MRIVHVFTKVSGEYGNPVGIVLDEKKELNDSDRLTITTQSGYSEVVFINSILAQDISIFSQRGEIPFAGHAAVGAAYFFHKEYNQDIERLTCMGDTITAWQEEEQTWVRGNVSTLPPWQYEQLANAAKVEYYPKELGAQKKHTVVWAWVDKRNGTIRARTFAPDWGIEEDEANGSGAMKFAAERGKNLHIYSGKGSIIFARPYKGGFAEVGGYVKMG